MELPSKMMLTNATPLKPALTFMKQTAKANRKTGMPVAIAGHQENGESNR